MYVQVGHRGCDRQFACVRDRIYVSILKPLQGRCYPERQGSRAVPELRPPDRAPDLLNTTESSSRPIEYDKITLLPYDIRQIRGNTSNSSSRPTKYNKFVVRTIKIRQILCPDQRSATKYNNFVIWTATIQQCRCPD